MLEFFGVFAVIAALVACIMLILHVCSKALDFLLSWPFEQ